MQEGDEVFGRQTLDRMRELNGTYAEYVIVESSEVYKKPSTRERSFASPPFLIPYLEPNSRSFPVLALSSAHPPLFRRGTLLEPHSSKAFRMHRIPV